MKPTLTPMQRAPGTHPGAELSGHEFDHFYLAPRISTTGTMFPFSLMLSWRKKGRIFIFYIKLVQQIINKIHNKIKVHLLVVYIFYTTN
jgi:hypothetical protein